MMPSTELLLELGRKAYNQQQKRLNKQKRYETLAKRALTKLWAELRRPTGLKEICVYDVGGKPASGKQWNKALESDNPDVLEIGFPKWKSGVRRRMFVIMDSNHA